jgi:DNA-binding transcriptional LysR family regulator
MTLKQLEVFLAVADTRSFSKGGEAVSLAQSTASQHIRALEDELESDYLIVLPRQVETD